MRIVLCKDKEEAYRKAARFISNRIRQFPRLRIGLWNGNTAENIYKYLLLDHEQNGTSWYTARIFGFEEFIGIPKDHPETFQNRLMRNFLGKMKVDADMNVFFPIITDSPDFACKKFEEKLKQFQGVDLQLLSIGEFGNIGFNVENSAHEFSRTRVINLPDQFILQNVEAFGQLENVPTRVITQGIATVKTAKEILVVAIGKEKADSVLQLLAGSKYKSTPVSTLLTHPNLTLIVDSEAARSLPEREGMERASQQRALAKSNLKMEAAKK